MRSRASASEAMIVGVLVLQFIPLMLFPPESFSPKSQEWWLPALLTVLVFVADVELIARRSTRVAVALGLVRVWF